MIKSDARQRLLYLWYCGPNEQAGPSYDIQNKQHM